MNLVYVFLQMSSIGGAVVFAQVDENELTNYTEKKSIITITLSKPLLLFQKTNPKGELVNSMAPFPTTQLPVINKTEISIGINDIIWIKQISELTATEDELKLIKGCKETQIKAYSPITKAK